jgi:hypothetical protein
MCLQETLVEGLLYCSPSTSVDVTRLWQVLVGILAFFSGSKLCRRQEATLTHPGEQGLEGLREKHETASPNCSGIFVWM